MHGLDAPGDDACVVPEHEQIAGVAATRRAVSTTNRTPSCNSGSIELPRAVGKGQRYRDRQIGLHRRQRHLDDPPGAMRTTVSVALLPDELEEGDETLAAILSDPTGAIILDGSGRWNPSALEGDLR